MGTAVTLGRHDREIESIDRLGHILNAYVVVGDRVDEAPGGRVDQTSWSRSARPRRVATVGRRRSASIRRTRACAPSGEGAPRG